MSLTKKFEQELSEANKTEMTKIASPEHITEKELEEKKLTSLGKVSDIQIKHAYCPECGEELISKLPPMFNPFTGERQCIHKCGKCSKSYNLDYSYPRLVFLDEQSNEIFAHCE